MNRRTYIGLCASGALGLAGCTEESSNSVPADTPNQGSDPTQSTRQRESGSTDTPTPEPVVDAEVQTSDLVVTEGEYRTTAAATGEILNTGDTPLLLLDALAKFYNSDDELLNTAFGQAMGVFPDEVWIPRLIYTGDGTKVERATLEVDNTDPTIPRATLTSGGDAFEVTSSNLQIPADATAMPRVTATVRNVSGGEIQRVRFIGKVYNGDGQLLSTSTDVVSSFSDGEVWSVDSVPATNRDRIDQMTDLEVLLYYY